MQTNILQRLVAFRHQLHQFPQKSLHEFETKERLLHILKSFGVEQTQLICFQPITSVVVDLRGKAKPLGKDRMIAFRADMDALEMTESNFHLQYKSKNEGIAHMCGHDGHMACLVGLVPLFLSKINQIGSNKCVRLIFQPSEEGQISGAQIMVKSGVLNGVDEVYGFHNWPSAALGELWCQEGPVMSEITFLKIKIIGTGGHGSEPENLKVSILEGISFYQQIRAFMDHLQKQKPNQFVCTLPIFKSGERFNVIADHTIIEGSIRSFQVGLKDIIINKIYQLLEHIKAKGFFYEFDSQPSMPMVINTKAETEHVLRVATRHFGKQKVSKGPLPFRASQDFSFFLLAKPGAFFFLSSGKCEQKEVFLHNNKFDFNDDLIQKASTFWMELAVDRLQLNQ